MLKRTDNPYNIINITQDLNIYKETIDSPFNIINQNKNLISNFTYKIFVH